MKGLLALLRDEEEERWLMPLLSGAGDRAGYIAWLRARGEARGELMEVLDRLVDGDVGEERDGLRARAVELGAQVDRDWLLLMRRVHGPFGCGVGEEEAWPALERGCAQSWELLEEEDAQTRRCATCAQRVYLCGTREEAVWRAEAGERVALVARVLDAIMSEVEHEIEGYVVAKRTWWRRGVGSR